jgi:GTP-binding protein
VGKSTLLNALVGRRVARTSGTPGKTRMMNVFEMRAGAWGRGDVGPSEATRSSDSDRRVPQPHIPTPRAFYFLDLPGYGYARVGRGERTAFRGLLRHALERPRLAGVVWLLDLRRDPSAEDAAVQDQFAAAGVRVLAAATKSDKLPPRQRQARAGLLRDAVGLSEDQFVLTSATSGAGVDELREAIEALVGERK